jgi:oligopeptide/dipeptide ABC transporter ATP-binding protein
MYLGKLVEVGPAEEVYAHTVRPYTRGLIDTIPVPDPALARTQVAVAVHGELPSAITPPSGCCFRMRCPPGDFQFRLGSGVLVPAAEPGTGMASGNGATYVCALNGPTSPTNQATLTVGAHFGP